MEVLGRLKAHAGRMKIQAGTLGFTVGVCLVLVGCRPAIRNFDFSIGRGVRD